MKNVSVGLNLAILSLGVLVACSQYSHDENSGSLLLVEPGNGSESEHFLAREICANSYYADRLNASNVDFSWMECDTGPEVSIEAYECARLWAEYNPSWDYDLNFLACGGSVPSNLPNMEGFTKEISVINPSMSWDFMWAHYWKIERRVGTGSWTQVYSYTVPLEPMISAPDTNWVDTGIDLRTFENIVYYRIKGLIWSEYSTGAPIIYWDNRENPDSGDL